VIIDVILEYTLVPPDFSFQTELFCFFILRLVFRFTSWGEFHEHFTSSFYFVQIPIAKKYSQVVSLFALLGSALVKVLNKMLVKSAPEGYNRMIEARNDINFCF
jgi:hypothetical protein